MELFHILVQFHKENLIQGVIIMKKATNKKLVSIITALLVASPYSISLNPAFIPTVHAEEAQADETTPDTHQSQETAEIVPSVSTNGTTGQEQQTGADIAAIEEAAKTPSTIWDTSVANTFPSGVNGYQLGNCILQENCPMSNGLPNYGLGNLSPTDALTFGIIASLFSDGSNNNTGDTGIANTPTTTTDPTQTYNDGTGPFAGTGDYADFTGIIPAGDGDPKWSDVPVGPDLSNITLGLLGGIPLSPNASWTYSIKGPGSVKITPVVLPLNPEVDQETRFGALVSSTNPSVHVYPPAQYASETYTSGGNKTKQFKFLTIEYPKNKAPRPGYVIVTLNAKVYEGNSALCDTSENCNGGNEDLSDFGTDPGTTTGGGTTDTGIISTPNVPSYDNPFGNTNTNNGNNPDWMNSGFDVGNGTGTNGGNSSEFGPGFSDTTNNGGNIPGSDLASGGDLLGTDGSSNPTNGFVTDQNGGSFANGNNNGNSNGTSSSNPTDGNTFSQALQNVGSTFGVGQEQSTGTNSNDSGFLNGLFGKTDNIEQSPNSPFHPDNNSSLQSKIASLQGKVAEQNQSASRYGLPTGNYSGNDVQGLLSVANQMLLASGRSADEIKAGRTYDTGSAFTEPRDTWDLNRISTLMQKGQIKSTVR